MKKIPKSFQLFAHTITVRVIKRSDWGDVTKQIFGDTDDSDQCVGFFDPGSNAIFLVRQTKSQLSHAFWHEAIHATLYYLNHKLYSNEQFVDTVAGSIGQIIATAE